MGGSRARSQPRTVERLRRIPTFWLSMNKISKPITTEKYPDTIFYSAKMPVPKCYEEGLTDKYIWTAEDIAKEVRDQNGDVCLFIINTCSSMMLRKQERESDSFTYKDIPVDKAYRNDSRKVFNDYVLDQIDANKGKKLIFVVLCGLGINRAGYSIISFLIDCCEMEIQDAADLFFNATNCGFTNVKAIDAINDIFNSKIKNGDTFEWLSEERPKPLGAASINLYRGINWRKFTRKEAEKSDRDRVMKLIADATPKGWIIDPKTKFPHPEQFIIENKDIDKMTSSSHVVSFKPRGLESIIVVLDRRVFAIDSTGTPYLMMAKSKDCKHPFIATCSIFDEKQRVSILMTDVLMADGEVVYDLPLEKRLSILYNQIPRFKSELSPNDPSVLEFIFRPYAKIGDAGQLLKDLDKLYCSPDALEFIPVDGPAGSSLVLPTEGTTFGANFDFNGNGLGILVVRGSVSLNENVPIGVFKLTDPSQACVGGFSVRAVPKGDTFDLVVVTTHACPLPDYQPEVRELIDYMNKGINSKEIVERIDSLA